MNFKISDSLNDLIVRCDDCEHTDNDTHIVCRYHRATIKMEKVAFERVNDWVVDT